LSSNNSTGGKGGKKSNKDAEEFRLKRLQTYNSNEVPDPEILRQILEKKSKYYE